MPLWIDHFSLLLPSEIPIYIWGSFWLVHKTATSHWELLSNGQRALPRQFLLISLRKVQSHEGARELPAANGLQKKRQHEWMNETRGEQVNCLKQGFPTFFIRGTLFLFSSNPSYILQLNKYTTITEIGGTPRAFSGHPGWEPLLALNNIVSNS